MSSPQRPSSPHSPRPAATRATSSRALAAADLRRTRLAVGLSLCAAVALSLGSLRAHAAAGHGAADEHAAADEQKSIKPAKPSFALPNKEHKAEAAASAPAAAAPAVQAKGKEPVAGLEDLRQRLSDKVAEVRKAQEVRSLTLSNAATHGGGGHGAAPARHRPASGHAAAGHSGSAAAHAAHWSYAGEGGPQDWGQLKPEFSLCNLGTRQSPIDIREGIRVELDPVKFEYRPSGFNVVDNGHTVQVNLAAGNTILVGQRRFELLQFHFHRPSEERINGRQFEMVAHLVHKDLDGRLAVVAVLMDQGRQHPLVQQVWNNLPLEKNVAEPGSTTIDLNFLLPEDRRYYTYMGSLTTPPCSEGVQWIVLKQPATLSYEQLAVFSRLYPMNARPIQRAGDRLIKESN